MMELVSMIIPGRSISWRMSGNSVKSDLRKFRNHFN